jgi:major outer membrane protein
MQNKLKKLCPALALTLCTMTSVVTGADDIQMRNLENRVTALEQRRGANGMINPPARPVVRDGNDLWIQGEALFMHATEDGLAYGIKNENSTGLDGRVKNVGYDWDWGFRLGAGYNFPHDGWDALLNWTWFRTHEKKQEGTDANEIIWQTVTNPSNGPAEVTAHHADGHSKLHLNLLDLEMGREFFVSKWLTLRPFVGGRAAWLNRSFTFEYKLNANGAALTEAEGHNHNRFRGGGLRTGLNSQWGLGWGWSFFGDFALSLIYGTQRIHAHQETDPGDARIGHIHNAWTISRPMLDLALGLRWDHLFYDDAYRIRIQLGWEQHTLWGFNKDMNFVSDDVQGKYTFNQGDLTLQGLALQARFDF